MLLTQNVHNTHAHNTLVGILLAMCIYMCIINNIIIEVSESCIHVHGSNE